MNHDHVISLSGPEADSRLGYTCEITDQEYSRKLINPKFIGESFGGSTRLVMVLQNRVA